MAKALLRLATCDAILRVTVVMLLTMPGYTLITALTYNNSHTIIQHSVAIFDGDRGDGLPRLSIAPQT